MNKRTFLKWSAGVAAAVAAQAGGLLPLGVGLASPLPRKARVRPTDAGWPTSAQWESLRRRVGGRLQAVADPLRVCREEAGSAQAAQVLADMRNPFYVQEQAGGTESSGWVDAWSTSVSARAVEATCAADVAAAVDFAREHRLRLVVKGGAHSYLGQSCAPDSLLVWTHRFQGIDVHEGFVPRGAPNGTPGVPAVSVEPGAVWLRVYDRVIVREKRYVQGGGCASVGVPGHLQTGGFGSFSKRFGMSAAGILELEIVTSDGQIRVANRFQNADLFWAWKGAGAAFGIATRVTLRTLPLPETFGSARGVIAASSDTAYAALVDVFMRMYRDGLMNPHWGESVTLDGRNRLSISMVFQGLTQDQATRAMQPLLDYVATRPEALSWETPLRVHAIPACEHFDYAYRVRNMPASIVEDRRPGEAPGKYWFSGDSGQVSAFWAGYESGWLHRRLLEAGAISALTRALVTASRHHEMSLHFNKGLAGAPAEVAAEAREATCVNPIVSDAFALVIIGGGQQAVWQGVPGHEPDGAALRREARDITAAMAAIRLVAPDAGGYSSEMSFHASDWREAAWGAHYPQLLALKDKYDPAGLFVGHHYVGSERWSPDGFTPKG